MKSRIAFLVISLLLLLAITAFAEADEKPQEVYLIGQEMQDGTTRYEGTNGSIAIVEEWHPATK